MNNQTRFVTPSPAGYTNKIRIKHGISSTIVTNFLTPMKRLKTFHPNQPSPSSPSTVTEINEINEKFSQMKFVDPVYVNFLDVSTPLKLNGNATLKYLSACVGVDKNQDYVADFLVDTERLCSLTRTKSQRNIKVHSLNHYKSGLNREMYEFAHPYITVGGSYLLHIPSSDIPFPLAFDQGIYQDQKFREEIGDRIIAKHCGGYNQVTVIEDEIKIEETVTVKDCVCLSEDDYILILTCTPNLNCPGYYWPPLFHQSLRGKYGSLSRTFDLKPGEDAEAFARGLMNVLLNYNVRKREEKVADTLNRLNENTNFLRTSWDIKYDKLVKYYEKFGNSNVPNGIGLGRWVTKQRIKVS